jgi:hypothetical protein
LVNIAEKQPNDISREPEMTVLRRTSPFSSYNADHDADHVGEPALGEQL